MFVIYLWSFYPRGHVFASDVVIWKDRNDKSSKFILFIDRKQSSHIICLDQYEDILDKMFLCE